MKTPLNIIFLITVFSQSLAADIDLQSMKMKADNGDVDVMYNLGVYYEIGGFIPPFDKRLINTSEAIRLYSRAASSNYPPAQFNLGVMHANGKGTPTNIDTAFKLISAAANGGLDSAQYSLGVLYATGQPSGTNDVEALKWYKKASEKQNEKALYNVGVYLLTGRGGEQNLQAAKVALKQSAILGVKAAQVTYPVALCLGERSLDPLDPGLITSKISNVSKDDLKEALAFFEIAFPKSSEADAWKRAIESKLTKSERREAERLVSKYRQEMSNAASKRQRSSTFMNFQSN